MRKKKPKINIYDNRVNLSTENVWKNGETYQGNDERTKRKKNDGSNVGQSSEDPYKTIPRVEP